MNNQIVTTMLGLGLSAFVGAGTGLALSAILKFFGLVIVIH
jgi:hypothetical protein